MVDINSILELIPKDTLKALLAIEALKKAGNLTKEVFDKLSKAFIEAQRKKKFGCTVSTELAKKLIKIDSTPDFLKLKGMLKRHPTLKLARIGLYVETLYDTGARDALIYGLKGEISENHGPIGMRFLRLGSSGLLSELIDRMKDLQEHENLNTEKITEYYEYSINKLEETSIWVSNSDIDQNVELRITDKMSSMKPQLFMIIAAGYASTKAMKVIAELSNSNVIRRFGYIFFPPKIKGEIEKRKQYLWIFYKFV